MSTGKASFGSWAFTLYLIFSCYSLGVGMSESLANYPSWLDIGPDAFPGYYATFSKHFGVVFAPAFFLSIIAAILMIWFRPQSVPAWGVFTVLILKVIMLVVSIIYLAPMSLQMGVEFSAELMEELLASDKLFRVLPAGLIIITNLIMLKKAVSSSQIT